MKILRPKLKRFKFKMAEGRHIGKRRIFSHVASRRHLRSTSRRQLLVLRHNLSTYGRRAFSVAGPAAWNCLCDELREPLLTANSFKQLLKTRLFAEY